MKLTILCLGLNNGFQVLFFSFNGIYNVALSFFVLRNPLLLTQARRWSACYSSQQFVYLFVCVPALLHVLKM